MEKFKLIASALLSLNVVEDYIDEWDDRYSFYIKASVDDGSGDINIQLNTEEILVGGVVDTDFTKSQIKELRELAKEKFDEKQANRLKTDWLRLGVITS